MQKKKIVVANPIGIINNSEITRKFRLNQNYPNPFNSETTISYELRVAGYVKLYIHDITGKNINVLINQTQIPGTYEIKWRDENNSSGIYIYELISEDLASGESHTEAKRMVLIK